MPRGIKWDDLPNNFAKFRQVQQQQPTEEVNHVERTQQPREIDIVQDSIAIGKRVAFGVIVCKTVILIDILWSEVMTLLIIR